MIGGTAVAAAAAILYACLAAGDLSEKGVHKDNLVWSAWFVTVHTIA